MQRLASKGKVGGPPGHFHGEEGARTVQGSPALCVKSSELDSDRRDKSPITAGRTTARRPRPCVFTRKEIIDWPASHQ
jgi:hypothetical protein